MNPTALPDSFCKWPFFNVMINARGQYLPCCKYIGTLTHHGEVLAASHHTVEKAFNCSEMVELRSDFWAGRKPGACQQCWDEEDAGIRSMRFDGQHLDITTDQLLDPQQPIRMDLYPSNICNLRCRICNPGFSTAWIEEAKQAYGSDEGTHLNLTEENLAIVESWLPQLAELGFFGGEPLYQKETKRLLQKCVDTGDCQHINVLINTNTTIYGPEFVDWLTKFRQVWLNFSIDDIEGRFEYQRKNANWVESIENVRKFVVAGGFTNNDQLVCKICCTVSIFNVYYLPELFDWVESTFPGMPVYLNFLHRPPYFNIRNLAAGVKEVVERKLRAYSPEHLEQDKQRTRTLDDVLELLMQPVNAPDAFAAMFDHIERGDAFRRESFADVAPEYYAILKAHDPRTEQSYRECVLPILSDVTIPMPSGNRSEETTPADSRVQSNVAGSSPVESEKSHKQIDVFLRCPRWDADEQRRRQAAAHRRLLDWSEADVVGIEAGLDDEVLAVFGSGRKVLQIEDDLLGLSLDEIFLRLIERHGAMDRAKGIRNEVDEQDRLVLFGDSEQGLFLRAITLPRFSESGQLIGTVTQIARRAQTAGMQI